MSRIAIVVSLALVAGCGPAMYRTVPDYQGRLPTHATVALMPPHVEVYRVSIDQTKTEGPFQLKEELVAEWSEAARGNVGQAISRRVLDDGSLALKISDAAQSRAVLQEHEDIRPMFEAVAMSVLAHGYEYVPPLKKDLLGYSLGPLPALREATGADAALFVYAVDHVLAAQLHAWNVFLAIMFSGGVRAPTGGGLPAYVLVPTSPPTVAGGANLIVAALVDLQTGDILWLAWQQWESGKLGAHDLRKASSAETLVGKVFEDLAASRGR